MGLWTYFLLGAVLSIDSLVAFQADTECGKTRGCFSECGSGDCSNELTWRDTGLVVEFTLKATISSLSATGNWIAFGLSSDKRMGGDTVFECITDASSTFIQRSRNDGYSNVDVVDTDSWITQKTGTYSNGVLSCSFSVAKSNGGVVDLAADWYILLPKGEYSGSKKKRHSTKPIISDQMADFQNFASLGAATPSILPKLHGIMMVAAWILCASIGIVVARYYKPVWLEEKLLGEKVWFTIHRTVMVFAVLFCIAGFVLIFVFHGTFREIVSDSDFKKAHPFIGLIVMCLAIIQPVMAIFRPHPGESNRVIFNWAHWAVGIVAHLLAVLNIIIGVLLDAMELPKWVVYIVVAYAVYQIVIELLLEVHDCISRNKDRSAEYAMRETDSMTKGDLNQESKYKFKKIVLILHTLIIIGFSTALIVLIAIDLSRENDD